MRDKVNRQVVIAVIATLIVLAAAASATVRAPFSELRSLDAQIDRIENPAPAPDQSSPEQLAAIPEAIDRDRVQSAIRSAASDLGAVKVSAGEPRRTDPDGPLVHPFTVTLSATPAELADFVTRLQQPLRFEGPRIVGTKGALLLSVSAIGPASGGDASRMRVTVLAYSRR